MGYAEALSLSVQLFSKSLLTPKLSLFLKKSTCKCVKILIPESVINI